MHAMCLQAYDCVGDAAVQRAQSLLTNIMRDCSQDIIDRLVDTGACVAIIGRSQVTTDIPEHDFMKMAEGTVSGLGWKLLQPRITDVKMSCSAL